MVSIDASRGTHALRCSWVPYWSTIHAHMLWIDRNAAVVGSAAASCSKIRTASSRRSPLPPTSSPQYIAAIPSSAASRSASTGKWCVTSHSKACGASRLAANAAAFSGMTRSSSSSLNILDTCLLHRRDDELGAVAARGPPLRHGLDLGVELDRRRAVLIQTA